jgi:hypothetical protein
MACYDFGGIRGENRSNTGGDEIGLARAAAECRQTLGRGRSLWEDVNADRHRFRVTEAGSSPYRSEPISYPSVS